MNVTSQRVEIRNQPGPQRAFDRCTADIAIFGGSAGGGKSFALLMNPLREIHRPKFEGIIFRQSAVQVRQSGGLWDKSMEIYPHCVAQPYSQALRWRFPSGAQIRFSYLDHAEDKLKHMGAEYAFIGFDELTHFDESTFWFLLSRLRTMCGIKPRVRATCNPDASSWVAQFIEWWIDQDTGYAIPERSGVVRWFARVGDTVQWRGTAEELLADFPDCSPMSATFIRSLLSDNQKLLLADPSYLHKLKNLQRVERERLLHGNWKIMPTAGNFFRGSWFQAVPAPPEASILARCRFWDRAASKPAAGKSPDWTVGLLMARDARGVFYVEDVQRMQETPHQVEQAMINCASTDPKGTIIGYMQDPASAGVNEAQFTARALAGYHVKFEPATGKKDVRAKPASSQAEAGNIKLVKGLDGRAHKWAKDFLTELENFPEGSNDDQVDALSGAFNMLVASGQSGQFAAVGRNNEQPTRLERPERGRILMG